MPTTGDPGVDRVASRTASREAAQETPADGIAPDADQAFRDLDEAFQRATRACPGARVEAHYQISGRRVLVRTVGRDLAAAVDRAFKHLRLGSTVEAAPALTIDFWDETETGVGCRRCVAGSDLNAHGTFSASPDGRFVVTERAQTKTVLDRRRQRIIGWVGDQARLTLYELGRPLHTELLLWHRDHELLAVHAGLVARRGDGVLVGGPGGSGKSTVALTCLLGGFEYLADDYVGVEPDSGGAFHGHSLYCSTHVEPAHLGRFPALKPHGIPGSLPREDKSLIMLSDAFEERLARSARIRAIALPIVVESDQSAIRPASKVEALLRLAPSSLLLLPYAGVGKTGFRQLTSMVEQLPTFWFDLGRDLEEIPRRVGEILDRTAEAA